MDLGKLTQKIESIVPIDGMSAKNLDDKSTWVVRYKQKPTAEELALVQKIIDDHLVLTPEQVEENAKNQFYLLNTDAQIALHLEEMAGNLATTLTEEEFIALVNAREQARKAIVKE